MSSSKNVKIEGADAVLTVPEPASAIQTITIVELNEGRADAATTIQAPEATGDSTATADQIDSPPATPHKPKPVQSATRVVEYTSETGGISLSFVAGAGDKPVFSLRDRFGNAHIIKPGEFKPAKLHDVNLIGGEREHEPWILTSGNARLGKNLRPDLMLDQGDTYYVVSEMPAGQADGSATVTFRDPIDKGDIPVGALTRYQFDILAATHRCAATLRLSFKTATGETIEGPTRKVARGFNGGPAASDYDRIVLQFIAPANARSLCVQFDKGPTDQKKSSYLFFARPSLRDVRTSSTAEPISLPLKFLEQVRAGSRLEVAQVRLKAPAEIFEDDIAKVDLCIEFDGESTTVPNIVVSNKSELEILKLSVDASRVEFSGRALAYIADPLNIGVFVDGVLSGSSLVEPDGQNFGGVIFLSSKHLDGAAHQVELRLLPQLLSLASAYEILPMQITPWDAVQVYAGAPLDGTLAPAARHHLRSFRAWFEKIQVDPSVRIPPVYDELLGGFRKRKTYPRLTFSEIAKPTVSVVIPVHNKFEITYFCLCALQFAFNETTFEVIVVDDGSSDETVDIDDFVQGIKVIRHKTALGFVNSCNDGAAVARGEFVMMLNNDTEVTARWLDELLSVFRNFDNVGLAGSKLLYPDGHLQEAGGIVWNSGNPWNVGRNANAADPAFNYLRQTDYVSGAAIMLPMELWKTLGGFSPEFAPAYFEDTDLAMKVRAAGRYVVYVPTSTVYHYEGQSAGTSVASGMKRFQEVNRPKFKRKWTQGYGNHGADGVRPDREKDRNVAFRVLFVDQHVPFVDNDAGSYAAFQEIRLFQSQGAKVTFLPRNLAWMDRHTLALQRIGVECLYAPFVMDFAGYIAQNAKEYDVVYVTRYKIGEQVIPLIRSVAPNTKVILNVADLHFLRELREAASGNANYSIERAEATRDAELAVVRSSDLTFSYSDVELAVLESHISTGATTAKMPWIVETKKLSRSFEKTKDILFLGGFGHPPNEQAVKFFVKDVLPLVRERVPDVRFNVVGSGAPESIKELESDSVQILGYLPDLDDAFASNRIFVAPLLAGAGLKGKVLEAISRGVPSVLSPVAVEGSGLTSGNDCLVAKSAQEWADAVVSLYTDKKLWDRIGSSALNFAETRYSFAAAVEAFQEALAKVDVYGRRDWALVYQHTRPQRYGS